MNRREPPTENSLEHKAKKFWEYQTRVEDMPQDQIHRTIIAGLNLLTSTQLVNLHAEISRVQIEHSHNKKDDHEQC